MFVIIKKKKRKRKNHASNVVFESSESPAMRYHNQGVEQEFLRCPEAALQAREGSYPVFWRFQRGTKRQATGKGTPKWQMKSQESSKRKQCAQQRSNQQQSGKKLAFLQPDGKVIAALLEVIAALLEERFLCLAKDICERQEQLSSIVLN